MTVFPAEQWPVVMGVLNVTSDSFSDGGRYLDRETAIARGFELRELGVDIVDVGGKFKIESSVGRRS